MDVSKRIFILLVFYLTISLAVILSSGMGEHHSFRESEPQSSSVNLGKELWQKKQCTVCHSIFGLGGHEGPDLTNVYSRRDQIYIKQVVKNGVKKMPAYNLSDDEIAAIINYLKYLNNVGTYPLKSVKTEYFGPSHK